MKLFGIEFKFNGFDIWHKGNFNPSTVATTGKYSDLSGTPSTLDGYGILDAVNKAISLANNVDLNTVVTSGFYRINNGVTNGPSSNVSYGQLIVSRGSDTVFQIITGYSNNEYYMRQASRGGGTDTNFASWQPWRRIWHDGNFDPAAKAPLTSPAFAGTPTAPTPSTGTNSTQIATTAFVKAQGYITAAGSGAKIAVSSTAPSSPQPGDFWYKEI